MTYKMSSGTLSLYSCHSLVVAAAAGNHKCLKVAVEMVLWRETQQVW